MKFKVKRQHYGDKLYNEGEEREASERDVAHLVQRGILEPIKEKAKEAPKNKARTAPSNKGK